MIVVRQKPLGEIVHLLAGHGRVLLAGCNTCAAVALAGGEKEVETLQSVLKLSDSRRGESKYYGATVVTRQCEPEYVEAMELSGFDAILSLGCGAGVAFLAERTGLPVYPALDTIFIGAARGLAEWRAECSACGTCVLGETAGICPVTRCAKGIMNGPCGGVDEGRCEVDPDRECAWVLIYERLDDQGAVERFDASLPPKDHSVATRTPSWKVEDGDDE
jgi:hypothetical protein